MRHTYGEYEGEEGISEEKGLKISQGAVHEGVQHGCHTILGKSLQDISAAPKTLL